MELNKYYKGIIDPLQHHISFSEDDLVDIEFLKSCDSVQEKLNALYELMDQGDIQKIKDFPSGEIKTTFEDYTFLLIKLRDKNILVSSALDFYDKNKSILGCPFHIFLIIFHNRHYSC